jgi:hypothetical protein
MRLAMKYQYILLLYGILVLTVLPSEPYAFDPEDYPWRLDGQTVLVNNRYDITLSFDEIYKNFNLGSVYDVENYYNMYAYAVKPIAYPEDKEHTLGEVELMRLFYDMESGNLIYQWTFYDSFDDEELENDIKAFHEYFGLERP